MAAGIPQTSVAVSDDVPRREHDVVLERVYQRYGQQPVLEDVSLSVAPGEFFGILGPSGSGKTTTLRVIGGFSHPCAGRVYLQNQLMGNRPPYRRNVTTVFQNLALFPHMTVYGNLAYGLKRRRVARSDIRRRVDHALAMVRLEGLAGRCPRKLSGGQQQRVALARALILEPAVVLLDEPLGSLDLKLRRDMQIELKRIQRRLGITFIYVTHDQQEALNLCDRIAVMNAGRIEQVGTARDIYERPRTRFVADFIGDTNFVTGRVMRTGPPHAVLDCDGFAWAVETAAPLPLETPLTLSIRPERVRLEPAGATGANRFGARLADMVYNGASVRCLLELENRMQLAADVDARAVTQLTVGDRLTAGWEPADGYVVNG